MQVVQDFYDNLAASYQFIFADWQQAVYKQADNLSNLLHTLGETPSSTLLDCTCGIGTQAIGLASKGYQIHGTDLSPRAIEQARENAQKFELSHEITFAVADLLSPPANVIEYDVVFSCDNAVAHFHSEDDLHQAVHTMLMQVKSGGLLMISLRDYDAILKNPPRATPVHVNHDDAGQRMVFQVWDWADDFSAYHLQIFIIRQDGEKWITEMHPSHLRAWQRADITKILENLGVTNITWHMPEDGAYYQPIVTGRKSER